MYMHAHDTQSWPYFAAFVRKKQCPKNYCSVLRAAVDVRRRRQADSCIFIVRRRAMRRTTLQKKTYILVSIQPKSLSVVFQNGKRRTHRIHAAYSLVYTRR